MRVKIAGKYYDLAYAEIDDFGQCDDPREAGKRIRIKHQHGDDKDELDTTLHELLHAGLWQLDEETVTTLAHDFANVLWRLGWRKTGG